MRRLTKKEIRFWEKMLAEAVVKSLARWDVVDTQAREEIRFSLTSLLSSWLMLDAKWPHKERWLDEIAILSIKVAKPGSIVITGKLWWGLWKDIGDTQWREPLKATIKLTKQRKPQINYEIVFGKRGKRRCYSNRT